MKAILISSVPPFDISSMFSGRLIEPNSLALSVVSVIESLFSYNESNKIHLHIYLLYFHGKQYHYQ